MNFAKAQFVGAIFKLIPGINQKIKRNSEFASLISFLCSLRSSRINLNKFAPIRDALYLSFKVTRKLVIREKQRRILVVSAHRHSLNK